MAQTSIKKLNTRQIKIYDKKIYVNLNERIYLCKELDETKITVFNTAE